MLTIKRYMLTLPLIREHGNQCESDFLQHIYNSRVKCVLAGVLVGILALLPLCVSAQNVVEIKDSVLSVKEPDVRHTVPSGYEELTRKSPPIDLRTPENIEIGRAHV